MLLELKRINLYMILFRQSFLFILALFSVINCSFSQTKKEVIQKYLDVTKKYKNYHIVYKRDFKFQSSDDTSSLVIDGVYGTMLKVPLVANINIIDTAWGNYILAYNGKYIARFWKDSSYYLIDTFSKNKYHYQNLKNDKYFEALSYSKSFMKEADFQIYDNNYFLFTFKDSSVSMNMTITTKTMLYISRTTYLPMKSLHWAWFEGGVQYSNTELKSIENLEHQSFMMISKQCDSVIKVIRTYRSLDSIMNSRTIVYKELKVGDTLKNFLGHIHGTNDSMYFNQIKDSILILDFSYTTCGPCSAAVPHLINLNNQYKSKGVKLFAVDPYPNDWQRLDKYIAYYNINYPYLKIEHKVSMEFGIRAFPTFLILKNGIIKAIHIGYYEKMEVEISKELDALLK